MIRNSFITSDVARVFRPAGVARRSLAGLKTCATSGERRRVMKPVRTFTSPLCIQVRVALATCALILCAGSARAQFDSAQVSGVVQDTTGGVLPGVDVTLTNTGTGQERRTVTNEAGVYAFPNTPVGTYTVTAALTGFKGVSQTGVQVNAGVNIRVDVGLAVGAVSETVRVEGASAVIDTSVLARTVGAEQLSE